MPRRGIHRKLRVRQRDPDFVVPDCVEDFEGLGGVYEVCGVGEGEECVAEFCGLWCVLGGGVLVLVGGGR